MTAERFRPAPPLDHHAAAIVEQHEALRILSAVALHQKSDLAPTRTTAALSAGEMLISAIPIKSRTVVE